MLDRQRIDKRVDRQGIAGHAVQIFHEVHDIVDDPAAVLLGGGGLSTLRWSSSQIAKRAKRDNDNTHHRTVSRTPFPVWVSGTFIKSQFAIMTTAKLIWPRS